MYCNLVSAYLHFYSFVFIILFNLFFLDVVNLFDFPFKMWSTHTACLEQLSELNASSVYDKRIYLLFDKIVVVVPL